jgi:hypothetical protein
MTFLVVHLRQAAQTLCTAPLVLLLVLLVGDEPPDGWPLVLITVAWPVAWGVLSLMRLHRHTDGPALRNREAAGRSS